MLVNTFASFKTFAPSTTAPATFTRRFTISDEIVDILDISKDDITGDKFRVIPVSVDLSGSFANIKILPTAGSGKFATILGDDAFNGYAITFEALSKGQTLLNAVDVLSAENSLKIPIKNISFTRDTVFVNVNGMQFSSGNEIVMQFGFQISGTVNADRLKGSDGRDKLLGLAGNDVLSGGMGRDILTGGRGKDIFKFDNYGIGNYDNITDFNPRTEGDSINLSKSFFSGLKMGLLPASSLQIGDSDRASGSGVRIIYKRGTGELFYDHDGNGLIQPFIFAKISPNLTLFSQDFFVN